MADVPSNPRLWQMLTAQARSKFSTFPSLPASKWIHTQYVQKGGQFVSEASSDRAKKTAKASRQFQSSRHRDADKKKAKDKDAE